MRSEVDQLAGPQRQRSSQASSMFTALWVVKEEPSPLEQGEGHGRHLGAWSGCRRTSRRTRAWNGQKVVLGTGESLLGPVPAGDGSVSGYKRQHREKVDSREGVGGGRSSGDGQDNTTCFE